MGYLGIFIYDSFGIIPALRVSKRKHVDAMSRKRYSALKGIPAFQGTQNSIPLEETRHTLSSYGLPRNFFVVFVGVLVKYKLVELGKIAIISIIQIHTLSRNIKRTRGIRHTVLTGLHRIKSLAFISAAEQQRNTETRGASTGSYPKNKRCLRTIE